MRLTENPEFCDLLEFGNPNIGPRDIPGRTKVRDLVLKKVVSTLETIKTELAVRAPFFAVVIRVSGVRGS